MIEIIQWVSWWFSCGAVGFVIGTLLDYFYYKKQPDNFMNDMFKGFLLGFLTLIVAMKTMTYIIIDIIKKEKE